MINKNLKNLTDEQLLHMIKQKHQKISCNHKHIRKIKSWLKPFEENVLEGRYRIQHLREELKRRGVL